MAKKKQLDEIRCLDYSSSDVYYSDDCMIKEYHHAFCQTYKTYHIAYYYFSVNKLHFSRLTNNYSSRIEVSNDSISEAADNFSNETENSLDPLADYETVQIESSICKKYIMDGKEGLINIESGELLTDPIYAEIDVFSEGLAAAMTDVEYHFLDEQGNIVITLPFDGYTINKFEHGIAIRTYAEINGIGEYNELSFIMTGFIDKSGEYIIPPIYTAANVMGNGETVLVRVGYPAIGMTYGFVSVTGEVLVEPVYTGIHIEYKNPSEPTVPTIIARKDGSSGIIDDYGAPISGFISEDIAPFEGRELTPARYEGKYGYINVQGDFVIQPQYDMAGRFTDSGRAMVFPIYYELKLIEEVKEQTALLPPKGMNGDYNGYASTNIYARIFNSQIIDIEGNILHKQEDVLLLTREDIPTFHPSTSRFGANDRIYAFDNVSSLATEAFDFIPYLINHHGYLTGGLPALNGLFDDEGRFVAQTFVPNNIKV